MVRGGFKPRFFELRKQVLYYYAKEGDQYPKGHIPLRRARIDAADQKTGKPFTIRIQQVKPVFTYLQCDSEQSQSEWLVDLRKAAGVYQEKIIEQQDGKRLRNWQRASMSAQSMSEIKRGRSFLKRATLKTKSYSVKVSHFTKADLGGKIHVWYRLSVQNSLEKEQPWVVESRFKDMNQLATALKNTFPIAVALFPKKKGVFGSLLKRIRVRSVDSDAAGRAVKLQQFWNCLMKSVADFEPKTDSSVKWVYAFLGIDDYERMLAIDNPERLMNNVDEKRIK